MTLRDGVTNVFLPVRTRKDLTEPEFWIYLGVLAIGYTGLAHALAALKASVPVVFAVGLALGLLAARVEQRLKDRIDARRDEPVGDDGEEVAA
jgi:hypothetical protein